VDKRGQPDTSIRDAVKSVSKELTEKYVQEIVKEATERVLGKQSEKLNEKEIVKLEKRLKRLSDEEKLEQFEEAVEGASRDISQGNIRNEGLLEKVDTRLAETFEKKIPNLLPKIILPPLTKTILIAIAIIAVLILGLVNDDGQYWPEATIDAIDPNPATEGETIIFTGSGTTDDPDGYITAYRWESDRYDFLSSSQSFETTLPPGEHVITLQVRDGNGEWSEPDETYIEVLPVESENQPPRAHIDYIEPDTTVYTGTPVTFTGYGTDPDEDDHITTYEWRINTEIVSNAETFTTETLPIGTHTVQFRVKDNNKAWSELAEAYIKVLPLPSPDLFVSQFSLDPSTPVQYSQVSVRIGVRNQGTARSGSFIVEWWAGENFTAPACTWKVNSLAAGEERILTCTYKGYRSWYGWLTTKVVVDSSGVVAESNEENNTERKVISVSKFILY
jgi:hypothetical protein